MALILLVDDKRSMVRMLEEAFRAEGYDTLYAYNLRESISKLSPHIDAIVVDLKLPDGEGIELVKIAKEHYPFLPVIVITAYATIEKAVSAVKEGAYDFIQKPFDVEQLTHTVKRAIKERELRRENISLKTQFRSFFEEPLLVGQSEVWQNILRQIDLVAPLKTTVLIKGESGTGKELVARAIHTRGPRAKSSFITINCPAVPKDLLESELFGYEKGAFTGATESKPGRFELANKGTIFLDEIGDLDISLQSKLLRVLEYGEFERVGGVKSIKVDVRVIAATNKDIEEEIKKGKFREDLFFRINVFPIYIPPLRERKEDILPLAEHFVRLYAEELKKEVPSISDEMKAFLLSQDWKGNVRELKNTIERYMILCDKAIITPDMISVQNHNECYSDYTPLKDIVKASTGAAEKHKIIETLRLTKGNKLKASKLLKVSYKTLLTKIKNYGIDTE